MEGKGEIGHGRQDRDDDADEIGFGWIVLRWGAIGLGGSIFSGDVISVVVRDIWQRQCWKLAAPVLGCDRFWVDQ